jgi:hypothetical protein
VGLGRRNLGGLPRHRPARGRLPVRRLRTRGRTRLRDPRGPRRGTLAPDRYASYRKLEREEAFVTKKRDALALSEDKRQRKIFARSVRRVGWRGKE